MGVPNEVQQIAKAIDAMTLAELVADASKQELPTPGGDYDTKLGWEKRMGVGRSSARAVIDRLIEAGLAELKPGQVRTARGYSTTDLVYSPTLAKKLSK